MGKILRVDLSEGEIKDETIPDEIYENFLSGYGLAAKILFEELKPGIDPLGPDNILAIMSGLLTGTGSHFSGRWMAAGKSPLTGTWGDANCGGSFGPSIKQSGYDGFFFKGKSYYPVYLLIKGGAARLIKASHLHLWGKDSSETEDALKEEYGKDCKVACIGLGGEIQSLISGIVTDKGRLAARSGLGAVMGSKNLKAICICGDKQEVKVSNKDLMRQNTEEYLKKFNEVNSGFKYTLQTWGTAGGTWASAYSGDSPAKNWKGSGRNWHCDEDLENINFRAFESAERISDDYVTKYEIKKFACAECPLGCGGICSIKSGPHPLKETHRPEYETLCGFGTMLQIDDVKTIFKANHMLNLAGIDTISCSVIVAWAYEAFKKGIITVKDTDGLCLTWGNSEPLIPLIQKIIEGKGIGKHLRNGVMRASEYYAEKCQQEDKHPIDFAMHAGGQELPMHDPRNNPDGGGLALGVAYEVEPTPGRHTSSLFGSTEEYRKHYGNKDQKVLQENVLQPLKVRPRRFDFKGKNAEEVSGQDLADSGRFSCFINGLGMCNFSFFLGVMPPLVDWTNAATGWQHEFDDYLTIGQRIQTVRHAFNLREGISRPRMTNRARGIPPLEKGPNSGNAPDFDGAAKRYYEAMGWDRETSKPLRATLENLNLPYFLPGIESHLY
jgi:aldehyde:ferredoxin oxidoreductase